MRLQGKLALITGGTTGIGLAAAKLFHAEGARVFVTGRSAATLAQARDELRGVAEVIESDAGDVPAIERLVTEVAKHGTIDIAFLNAAILHKGTLSDLDERSFDQVFATNVKGPLFAIRALAPVMSRGGSIVLTSSINAQLGMPGTSLYASSKAALVSIGRVAAAELAPRGIRVNVLSPGPTATGITAKVGLDEAATLAHLATQIPLGRTGEVDEVARAALFLASTDASFMTGEELVVDGGMTRV
ncbi:MAG: SDR family oxidoreductase [Kofleriaceae bacterium]|nr:SDR family oxidoreductase [Kofleriaceae bacterium]